MPPVGINYPIDENYEDDDIDFTSFLDFTILDTQTEGITTELHRLREKVRGMLQDNANLQKASSSEEEKASSLEEEQASSPEGGPSQGPGAASEVGPAEESVVQPRVTRASSRSNPNTDDTYDSSLTPSQLLYLAKGESRIKTMDLREDFCSHRWRTFSVIQGFNLHYVQRGRQTVLGGGRAGCSNSSHIHGCHQRTGCTASRDRQYKTQSKSRGYLRQHARNRSIRNKPTHPLLVWSLPAPRETRFGSRRRKTG